MDVFISYSSKDTMLAQNFCENLKKRGISYWIAMENHDFGDRYAETIVTQIEESKVFLLLVTASSNTSKHVINEINAAVNRNKIIIPVMIGDFTLSRSMEYYLSSCHYLYYSENEFFWNNLFERISSIINKQNTGAPVETATPKKQPYTVPKTPNRYPNPPQTPVYPVNQPKKKKGKGCLVLFIITTTICTILFFLLLFTVIIPALTSEPTITPETFATENMTSAITEPTQYTREVNPEYEKIFSNANLTETDFDFGDGLENYVFATDNAYETGIITKLEYGVKNDVVCACVETNCFPASKYSEEKLTDTYEPFMELQSCDINIYSITDYIVVEIREYNLDDPEYLQELIDIGFIAMDDANRKISMEITKEGYLQKGYELKYLDQM